MTLTPASRTLLCGKLPAPGVSSQDAAPQVREANLIDDGVSIIYVDGWREPRRPTQTFWPTFRLTPIA